MTATLQQQRNRSRAILIFLFILFFLPMMGAWILYKSGVNIFTGRVNHGQLINPPLTLTDISLKNNITHDKWAMIYVAPQQCEKICLDNLYKMRQIRLELNADEQRMQRVLITAQGQSINNLHSLLAHQYFGTIALQIPQNEINKLLAIIPQKNLAMRQGGLYLADPLGNVMMVYAADANPSGIYKDLQRLLRVSQIG